MDTLSGRRVTPTVEPGYLRKLLPKYAPKQGDNFKDILKDVEKVIMPGVSTMFYLNHFDIKGDNTRGTLSAILYKEGDFCNFLFAVLHTNPLLTRGLL